MSFLFPRIHPLSCPGIFPATGLVEQQMGKKSPEQSDK